MAEIDVFILTYNERIHIERCIRSLQPFAANVFVVDCGSTDGTVQFAQQLGAHVVQHAWENNHARQTNWAIDHLPFTSPWLMRVDADEIVTPPLANEINVKLPAIASDVSGLIIKRRQVFLGRPLAWGGSYPIRLLRIWRRGQGRFEERWMDEHLELATGRTLELDCDLEDRNLNDLRWWTQKQANYAVREAADTLRARERLREADERADNGGLDPALRRRRWFKEKVYRRLPLFVRPVGYFSYRYLLQAGFADGAPGLIWNVLQGLWYRFLVDSVIYEVEQRAQESGASCSEVIAQLYGLSIQAPEADRAARGE
jgi:glycosyltransferase involved in cell wall biosynthesis